MSVFDDFSTPAAPGTKTPPMPSIDQALSMSEQEFEGEEYSAPLPPGMAANMEPATSEVQAPVTAQEHFEEASPFSEREQSVIASMSNEVQPEEIQADAIQAGHLPDQSVPETQMQPTEEVPEDPLEASEQNFEPSIEEEDEKPKRAHRARQPEALKIEETLIDQFFTALDNSLIDHQEKKLKFSEDTIAGMVNFYKEQEPTDRKKIVDGLRENVMMKIRDGKLEQLNNIQVLLDAVEAIPVRARKPRTKREAKTAAQKAFERHIERIIDGQAVLRIASTINESLIPEGMDLEERINVRANELMPSISKVIRDIEAGKEDAEESLSKIGRRILRVRRTSTPGVEIGPDSAPDPNAVKEEEEHSVRDHILQAFEEVQENGWLSVDQIVDIKTKEFPSPSLRPTKNAVTYELYPPKPSECTLEGIAPYVYEGRRGAYKVPQEEGSSES